MKTTNTTKSIKEDIVKDSIITDYLKYIQYLDNHNYVKESVTIYENLSTLVTINSLKTNNEGIVLDIMCPPGRIISIPGIKSYPENYHIEKIPPFEIKFANSGQTVPNHSNMLSGESRILSNGEEIDPETKIKILKNKILRKPEEICNLLYKDISMTNFSTSLSRFKAYTELYRFEYGIELKGEDHLKIYVVNPNIDINCVKFNLGTDLWTPI